MKTKLLAALLVALVLIGAGFTFQTQPSQAHAAWEYQVIALEPQLEDKFLKELGRAGWELVTISHDGRDKTFYFKRPAK
jgi:hypothetical protein